MRRLTPLAALLLFASAANAQSTTTDTTPDLSQAIARPATDSIYRRARRLVAEGNGVAGRALVDSLLRTADPAMPAYGDALYWHGALAPTAAEAERDYRRVIVEYPLAYYADDALLAIAELEQARGDRAGALAHLQRFVREHPASAGRGVAALGAARLAFEQRDTKLGCSMIAAARTSASTSDVELRNQIEYYGRQCPGTSVAAETPAAPAVSAPVASAPVAAPAVTRPSPPVASAPIRHAPDTAPISTMPAPVTPKPRSAPSQPAPARHDSAARTATRADVARPPSSMYTIQVAAYDTRPPAEQLVRKLATRGVKARVSGNTKPFRVRLDFYRTRQEAAKAVAALKGRGIIGFVAQEVPPAEVRSP
ncbi:MAG TPA: SPOR domain-containing protein [Gemmatimonadaceae bacterium]|nr:SPOR domain-containing protein [Gemmatimonadaceae bacterium]